MTLPQSHREALLLVSSERREQEIKWGGRSIASNPDLTPHQCLAILMEEVGEVARALLDHESDDRVRAELVQVAAVAVATIERILERRLR